MTNIPTRSLPGLLLNLAETHPDRVLIQETGGKSATCSEFHTASMKVADAIASLGIGRGDCIVTLYDTGIRAQSIWIGICWAGAMEVPVNPEFRGNSLIYGINDSKAKVVITSQAYIHKLEEIRDQLPHVETILTIDDAPRLDTLDNIVLADVEANAPQGSHREPELSDPYAVIYTSGTTGPSKGVVTPWGSLQYANANQLFSGDDPSLYDDAAYYSPWPAFHSSGRTGLTFAGSRNGRVVIRKTLSISAFWEDIRHYGCTHAHLLGIAGWLMENPERPDDAENPLRYVLMNPVIEDVAGFERRFDVNVTTGWGMTEIGFPMATGNITDHRTCGRLSPDYEARIVDDEGQDLPDGESGELIIRSHLRWLLFSEYLGKPEATKADWKDGWFHTGDVLRREADGSYFFVDRKSDYMRVRGNNVSSVELETQARLFPGVSDAAAVAISSAQIKATGRGSSDGEDQIRLFIQPEADSSVSESDLIDFLSLHLPQYMVPRFVQILDDFPRTPTGKVQKKALRSTALPDNVWDRADL